MLKIWGRRDSFNLQKALWCVVELGIAYERIDAGGRFGVTDTPQYLAMNPNGRVPTIDDDGFILWESNAIIRYLAEKYGAGTLCAADPQGRADAGRWMDWQSATIGPNMRALGIATYRTPPGQRDATVIAGLVGTASAHWAILDRHLADRDYVTGAAFSIGDIPIGAYAWRWFSIDIERPDLPNLEAWYGRLQEREPYRTCVMLPLG